MLSLPEESESLQYQDLSDSLLDNNLRLDYRPSKKVRVFERKFWGAKISCEYIGIIYAYLIAIPSRRFAM